MLLNKFGQPISLKSKAIDNLNQMDINELSNAPLLLTGCGCCGPVEYLGLLYIWKGGSVYTSKSIFEEIKSDLELHIGDRCNLYILPENVSTAVQLSDTETLSVTMIPIDAEAKNLLYLTEDKYSRNLITADLDNILKVLLTNPPLRKAIKDGIDVLFFDDSVFLDEQLRHSSELLHLRALIAIVRPRTCIGINGVATPILDFIKDYCREKDLYAEID